MIPFLLSLALLISPAFAAHTAPHLGHYNVRKAVLREGVLFTDCRVLVEGEHPVHPLWSINLIKQRPEQLSHGFVANYNQHFGVPAWGFLGEDFFVFPIQLPHPEPISPGAVRGGADACLAILRAQMRGEQPPPEAAEAVAARTAERPLKLGPLATHTRRHTVRVKDPLFFDFASLSTRDSSVLFAYEGTLHQHRFDDEAEHWQERWIDVDAVPTTMTGSFRALRSAERLVLIDEQGAVYTTPGDGHTLIGHIANWPTGEHASNRAVYLLEDAATHHLRILEVIDDPDHPARKKVIALPFELEDGRTDNPFHAELPNENIQNALIRLTDAIENTDD